MTRHSLTNGLAAAAALLCAAGCETTPLEPAPKFVGDAVVVTDYAQFFRLGPQQAGGADLSLRAGTRVMLRSQGFGYGGVQLEDGQVGYMANEDLQSAPPEPRRRPGRRGGSTGGRATRAASSGEEEFHEEIGLPDPSLDIMPEDVPPDPLPDFSPAPVEPAPPADPAAD